MLSQYGVQGFDGSTFDQVSAQLQMTASAAGGLDGQLTVNGITPCQAAALPNTEIGAVSAASGGGCTATATPLGQARIIRARP